MSRRGHVVRTDYKAGLGATRSLGDCKIYCSTEGRGDVGQGDSILVAPITLNSSRDYERCFVSASIGRISVYVDESEDVGRMVVELYNEDADIVMASAHVPSDHPAQLVGVTGLPEGESTLCIRLYPASWNMWGNYDDAAMQVIVGQVVDNQDCVQEQNGGPE